MELTHEFTVDRPLEEVWPVLIDFEAVADALPGASVEDAESDGTRLGKLRVKLGSFVASFRGEARYTALDDAVHQFTLEGLREQSAGRRRTEHHRSRRRVRHGDDGHAEQLHRPDRPDRPVRLVDGT